MNVIEMTGDETCILRSLRRTRQNVARYEAQMKRKSKKINKRSNDEARMTKPLAPDHYPLSTIH